MERAKASAVVGHARPMISQDVMMTVDIWIISMVKGKFFQLHTPIHDDWFQIVEKTKLLLETLDFVMQYTIGRFIKDILDTHKICIRVRVITKKKNNRFNNLLASKALLWKASCNF